MLMNNVFATTKINVFMLSFQKFYLKNPSQAVRFLPYFAQNNSLFTNHFIACIALKPNEPKITNILPLVLQGVIDV